MGRNRVRCWARASVAETAHVLPPPHWGPAGNVPLPGIRSRGTRLDQRGCRQRGPLSGGRGSTKWVR
eukprot:3864445-Pyramimonas_sp.AAC.1